MFALIIIVGHSVKTITLVIRLAIRQTSFLKTCGGKVNLIRQQKNLYQFQ